MGFGVWGDGFRGEELGTFAGVCFKDEGEGDIGWWLKEVERIFGNNGLGPLFFVVYRDDRDVRYRKWAELLVGFRRGEDFDRVLEVLLRLGGWIGGDGFSMSICQGDLYSTELVSRHFMFRSDYFLRGRVAIEKVFPDVKVVEVSGLVEEYNCKWFLFGVCLYVC
jgi:hypothetical protein